MYDLPTVVFDDTDRTLQFALKDLDGNPVDLTGWSLSFRLGEPGSSVASVVKSMAVTDGPAGECEVAFSAAETTALLTGVKKYSIRRVDSGNHQVVQYGRLPVEKVI